MTYGTTNEESAVFVQDDGSVLVYSLLGEFSKSFSMGSEAKDLKVAQAKIFQVSSNLFSAV